MTQLNQTRKVRLNMRMIWISAAVLAAMVLLSTWAWFQIPAGELIPVHWDINGNPDRYSGKFEGLFLTPIISAITIAIMAFVPLLEPRQQNLARSTKAFNAVWWGLLMILGGVHLSTVLVALGYEVRVDMVILSLIGVMFMIIGNFLGKVRSNFMFGIRTPWTLASDLSWNKTHRLGGRMFVVIGIGMVVIGLLPFGGWALVLLMSAMFAMLIWLFIYSYLVWRRDPAVRATTNRSH